MNYYVLNHSRVFKTNFYRQAMDAVAVLWCCYQQLCFSCVLALDRDRREALSSLVIQWQVSPLQQIFNHFQQSRWQVFGFPYSSYLNNANIALMQNPKILSTAYSGHERALAFHRWTWSWNQIVGRGGKDPEQWAV